MEKNHTTRGTIVSYVHVVFGKTIRMPRELENPETSDGYCVVKGIVPVTTAMDYPVKLASATGGKGSIGLTFAGYRKYAPELGTIRPRIGIDPLDTAKFILYARNAIQ